MSKEPKLLFDGKRAPRGKARKVPRYQIQSGAREHVHLWAYDYAELARLLGMTSAAVRMAVAREQLDPARLSSICEYWARRRGLLAKPTHGNKGRKRASARRAVEQKVEAAPEPAFSCGDRGDVP